MEPAAETIQISVVTGKLLMHGCTYIGLKRSKIRQPTRVKQTSGMYRQEWQDNSPDTQMGSRHMVTVCREQRSLAYTRAGTDVSHVEDSGVICCVLTDVHRRWF